MGSYPDSPGLGRACSPVDAQLLLHSAPAGLRVLPRGSDIDCSRFQQRLDLFRGEVGIL